MKEHRIRFRLPAILVPAASRAIHLAARWTRPLTFGACTAIIDAEARVFLVKPTYVRGWHLPGGGVEPGETIEAAARREVMEETGIILTGPIALHGLFHNRRASRRDHVAVYVATQFQMPTEAPGRRFEILDRGFFPMTALPGDTARATRARLDEIAGRAPPASDW